MKQLGVLLFILITCVSCRKNDLERLTPPSSFPEECQNGNLSTKLYSCSPEVAITTPEGYCYADQTGLYFTDGNGEMINSTNVTGVTSIEKGKDGIFIVQKGTSQVIKYSFKGELIWSSNSATIVKSLDNGGCYTFNRNEKQFHLITSSGEITTVKIDPSDNYQLTDICFDQENQVFQTLIHNEEIEKINLISISGEILKERVLKNCEGIIRIFPSQSGGSRIIQAKGLSYNVFLIDSNGVSTKTYESPYPCSAQGSQKIVLTADKGMLVLSQTESIYSTSEYQRVNKDIDVQKINANGSLEWRKIYGGISDETPLFIEEETIGTISLLATSSGYNGTSRNCIKKFYCCRIDKNGNGCD